MGKKCALISMPMMPNESVAPTLAIPILASALRASSIETDVYYFNLDFFKLLVDCGLEIENPLGEYPFHLFINRFFAEMYWGKEIDRSGFNRSEDCSSAKLGSKIEIKRQITSFFERLLSSTDWNSYSIVGFSCTYYQVIASLILSKMLKEKYPHLKIVFGGSFFEEGSSEEMMGVEKQIDFIVNGYSDSFIVQMFKGILEGIDVRSPAIISRDAGKMKNTVLLEVAPIRPNYFGYPDFSDYMLQYERLLGHLPPTMDVEIARGCKKASSSPCIFCDECKLNPVKAKSVKQFTYELREYNKRYGVKVFNINDSLIGSKTVLRYLEPLAGMGFAYNIFGFTPEITRGEMKRLARLKVSHMQIGIEAFDARLCRIMNKSQDDTLTCINTLKWAKYYGIERAFYNLLYGIPGEKKEDYIKEIALVRRLYHLFPPKDVRAIYGKRKAPLLSRADYFGVSLLDPTLDISDLFPKSYDKRKLAQFLDFSYPGKGECEEEIKMLIEEVEKWEKHFKDGAKLTYRKDKSGMITIIDSRYGEEERLELNKACSLILPIIDEPISIKEISLKAKMEEREVIATLSNLVAEGLAYTDDSRKYIGLALPEEEE